MAFRVAILGFLGVLVLVLSMRVDGAERRISLTTGDTFVLNWRDGWTVGEVPKDAPAGAMVFHGGDAKRWRATVSPLPPHPSLTGDIGNLRIYVRNMSRMLENGGVDVQSEQKAIDGPNAHGVYFQGHDSNPKAHAKGKDQPYSDGFMGAMSLGGKPYLFEVTWNAGGEADAKNALDALKSLRLL
jgi:hypothetical protein